MSERPTLRVIPSDVTVHSRWTPGTWTIEAAHDAWSVRATLSWLMRGECARSDVLDGRYLAIHLDGWTASEPPEPIVHAEWHTVAELIARCEGARA